MAEVAAPPAKLSDVELAEKRKAIEAKVAAMRLEQAKTAEQKAKKEEEQKATFFGEHGHITCDGCGMEPIVGYRYRCKQCANHDFCENCYNKWAKGEVADGLKKQVISSNAADHDFELHKDSKKFKPLVKGEGPDGAKAMKLPKPNEPCHCGSGKKFKKCHGAYCPKDEPPTPDAGG